MRCKHRIDSKSNPSHLDTDTLSSPHPPHTSHTSHTSHTLLPIPDSRLPIPDSLLPTPYSLLPTPYSHYQGFPTIVNHAQ
ncbi:MAG: hypothetical protein F6K50_13420 [Moorea sp. SIO3I7]|nr:hypothetical protein [Moorena sp. SIO3I7]